jgi:membrane protein DedA with SNARE-associated domain
MDGVIELVSRQGPLLLAAICFIEAIGLPLPAAIGLLGAGALAREGRIGLPQAFASGVGGLLAGDLLLFTIGRFTGWYFLAFLCRLSASPESCIYKAAQLFYRRGRVALMFAKFVPGVNTMGAPLAGSLQMRLPEFLAYDFAGVLIYAITYFGLGFVFSSFIEAIVRSIASAGEVVKLVFAAALAAYLLYRGWMAWRLRVNFLDVPRITPAKLAETLEDCSAEMVVYDVRSHGYYSRGAQRIQGAVRLEPNRLVEALDSIDPGKRVYLYCT